MKREKKLFKCPAMLEYHKKYRNPPRSVYYRISV